MKYFLILFFSFSTLIPNSLNKPDWSQTGHRVIGQIAEEHLSNRADKRIRNLLGGYSLAYVSTFADEIKSDRRYDKFKPWHYVNYPFGITYAESDKNPNGDVIKGINTCIRILKNKKTTVEDQRFYLKLLVHLVGDLHQPMHIGLAEDKGGNDFQVRWFNKGTNLHRLWDKDMIDHYKMSYTEIADNIGKNKSQNWVKHTLEGNPEEWADYIHKNITEKVYKSCEIGQKLGYRYQYDHFKTVEEQLYIAGIRLAKILNDIYG